MELALCLVIGGIWGGIWAGVLQFTAWGKFMAARRAWLAVVIGIGVDMLVLGVLLPVLWWLVVAAVIGVSSFGMIIRSLANEWREHHALMEVGRDDSHTAGE